MVEYSLRIDSIFASLADPLRRDILERVAELEQSVSSIASKYDVSLAAVSKHVKILESAGLIRKRRQGKEILVKARPEMLEDVQKYLDKYRDYQLKRYDALEEMVHERD